MTDWQVIYNQTFIIDIGVLPVLKTFYFLVERGVHCIRLTNTWIFLDPEPNILPLHDQLDAYTSHSSITVEQKEKLRNNLLENKELNNTFPFQIQYYDAEESFRGRWNSAIETELYLGRYCASEGFIAGNIPEGQWFGTILIPPCLPQKLKLVIQFETCDETKEEQDFSPNFYFDDEVEPASEEDENRKWFIGELHEHTRRSCGAFSPDETIEVYERQGFHFLALSDHDVQPVTAIAKEPHLSILRGEELESFFGHYMLLGTRRHVRWFQDQEVRNLEYMIHETHSQGGLFGILHPYGLRQGTGLSLSLDSKNWSLIDFMEVWPGGWDERFPEILKALDLWDYLLNRDIRIMGTCGKGGYLPSREDVMQRIPKYVIYSESSSESDLLAALKLGHSYMTVEPAVVLWAESQYGGAFMGDELRIPISKPFILRVTVTQVERCFIRIKTNNGILCEMPVSSLRDTDLKFNLRSQLHIQWFRVEVYRFGRPIDQLMALTNPLFVRGMVSV